MSKVKISVEIDWREIERDLVDAGPVDMSALQKQFDKAFASVFGPGAVVAAEAQGAVYAAQSGVTPERRGVPLCTCRGVICTCAARCQT